MSDSIPLSLFGEGVPFPIVDDIGVEPLSVGDGVPLSSGDDNGVILLSDTILISCGDACGDAMPLGNLYIELATSGETCLRVAFKLVSLLITL